MSIVDKAVKYSGYKLKIKNLLSMLTNSNRFEKDEHFKNLNPLYDIETKDIESLIKSELEIYKV